MNNKFKIEGLPSCTDAELSFLYSLSSKCGEKGAIVEIGSYIGRSAIALALAQKERHGTKIVTIDYISHKELQKNIEKTELSNWVEIITGISHSVSKTWNKLIELLFIDGNHCYWAVKDDIICWVPHIIEGGYIAFHDYGSFKHPGVYKAIKKTLLSDIHGWRVISDREVGSIIVFKKTAKALPLKCNLLHKIEYRFQIRDTFRFLKTIFR